MIEDKEYYKYDNNDKLPVVFNIHGGGFVGGDEDLLDTQSDRIANEWNMIVVAVNYTKADLKPMDYGVDKSEREELKNFENDYSKVKKNVPDYDDIVEIINNLEL